MCAKKPAGKTDAPFRRGTGGPGGTPLKEYAKPGKTGDFGRDLIEKLTGPGLNEDEYIQIAKKHGKSEKRFEAYIKYYRDQGFNIVELSKGCYVDKTEASNASGSSTPKQVVTNDQIPTKEDFESAYRMLTRPGDSISMDVVFNQIEVNAKKEGKLLRSDWRMIMENNIGTWSKKR